ncbi:DUF1659 domain-containing protein [Paraliobacillus salinarum]|uniref:DUF1659 domain-containing protein n=1 Tax=Paraliobacillus salinarum TaxID=1158996 RepID=UPI0015F5BF07|nr:DUF1659 domain-containing protein [Paraliobacillus salinarum]
MALVERTDTRLQLVFDNGVDEISGKALTKTKSFNNIKTTATAEQLLAISSALVPLQTLPLLMVKRNDTELISEV